ncbi:hypothetical protein H310_07103 [Aphanomyces invadans]|uniref:Homeobox domain-containing protein n=1 Tax=Aphanomyces invadans TaxID=157072 RepID=A0A024U4G4_9STRA|nr:hypothetical protein H310_07103 [Aphanomyces invadans]ETW00488.1 hypothetical protein H310_07103 [Aphanomyces invadans]|eukprot:XP_008870623.1 hypothetical protein H310_07103 [Aphanomyces invadans]
MSVIQTPHMVSIGMYSFWPTALENTGASSEVEHVSVPETLYQRLVDKDYRHHRAFGFIRESYRAWRVTALQVKRSKTPPSSPQVKMEVDDVAMPYDGDVEVVAFQPPPVQQPLAVVVPPVKNELHVDTMASSEPLDHLSMVAELASAVSLEQSVPHHRHGNNENATVDGAFGGDKKRKFRKCGTSNATRVLRDWLFDPHNQEHPYPSEQEKRRLSQDSGLTIKQIGIWFRNARQRLCAPTPTKATINQEQATAFMATVGLRIDESTPLRRGAWSPAENAYAQKLIDQFTQGRMPLVEGTPLRSFLAVVLHCHAMRISKKFVRDCSVGKITFRRDRMFHASGPEHEASMRDLLALKAQVLDNAAASMSKKTMETEAEAMKVQEWFRTTSAPEKAAPIDMASIMPKTETSMLAGLGYSTHTTNTLDRHMHDQLLEDLDFDFDGDLGWGELDKAVSQIFFP